MRRIVLSLVCASLLSSAALAGSAEDAAALYAKGNDQIAKADFDGAVKSYAAAAKKDSSNAEYRNEYSLLRRMITMRDGLAKEKNPEKWQANATQLRSFYYSHKLYAEALPLDEEFHKRQKSADSAAQLAETQLAMGKDADAEKMLTGLDEKAVSPQTQILQGIALARQNKMDAAKAVAGKVKLPADAGAGTMFDMACLKSLTGDTKGAAELLTKCFEQTAPSRLERVKNYVKNAKDLSAMTGTPEFATALKTESKVKESGCSGGGDCGSCGSKGKCSSSAPKAAAGTKK